MSHWIVKKEFDSRLKFKSPIMIEGLPGIGNVGKIAVDYLIDNLKPKLLYKVHSHSFPHSVFLNEKNQIELPSVNIFHYKYSPNDLLFLAGDVQPITETESYEFCEKMLDFAQEMNCNEIITLGGIGLPNETKSPAVFGAVTDADMMSKYRKYKSIKFTTNQKIEAIVGASGLLLGLARLRGIKGVSLLTETYANQFHVGFREAWTVLGELKKIFDLKIDLAPLEKEIEAASQEKIRLNRTAIPPEQKLMRRIKTPIINEPKPDIGYFG